MSLDIIDEEDGKIDSKSYNGSSKLEYTFDPIWKYQVHLVLENLEYNGPTEIVEGEDLIAQLIPKKNYRLPTFEEARDLWMVRVTINGNPTSDYYNYQNGQIEIPSEQINSYIEIYAKAVEKNINGYKVTLDANEGIFSNNQTIIEINDISNFDYTTFNKPTREGYQFIGFFTGKTGGKSFEEAMNSEAGIEEDTIFYARWKQGSSGAAGTKEPEVENPKTFDGIKTSVFLGIISLIGVIISTIKMNKKRIDN